jgi:hypothetical protein
MPRAKHAPVTPFPGFWPGQAIRLPNCELGFEWAQWSRKLPGAELPLLLDPT